MTKKTKFVAILESDKNVDHLILQNALSSLGKIISFDVDNDTNETEASVKSEAPVINNISLANAPKNSEIIELLNESNKIFFESISVSERKLVSIHILIQSNLTKTQNDASFKEKFISMLANKFELDEVYVKNSLEATKDDSMLETIKGKLLEADLNMMFIFIFRNVLSKGEEDFFETELIEGSAEVFEIENINEIKKMANERVKVMKAIRVIESDDLAFAKLKGLEKNVLLALVLLECAKEGGKISVEAINHLKSTFNVRLSLSSNISSFIFQKDTSESTDQKQFDSLIMKIEKSVTYKEKYELLVYLWEKLLSSEGVIDEGVIKLIKKLLRKFDMSDIESDGARKDAEAILEGQ